MARVDVQLRKSGDGSIALVAVGLGVVGAVSRQQQRILTLLGDHPLRRDALRRLLFPSPPLTNAQRASLSRSLARLTRAGFIRAAGQDFELTAEGRALLPWCLFETPPPCPCAPL